MCEYRRYSLYRVHDVCDTHVRGRPRVPAVATRGQGWPGQHAWRAPTAPPLAPAPSRRSRSRPRAAVTSPPTYAACSADILVPLPPSANARAETHTAAWPDLAQHAQQCGCVACTMHEHSRMLRARGRTHSVCCERGRSFDPRSQPHLNVLKSLFLHVARHRTCGERMPR